MIRILAVSLSAAALIAGSLPAAAQQRLQNPNFRGPAQPSFTAKRISGPKQPVGQRKFRSFSPPAPQITSGQRFHRSFNPPAPNGLTSTPPRAFSRGLAPPTPGTSQRSFIPQAPAGGQNYVGLPGSVPASLPAPSPGETSPTAAPNPQETAAAPEPPADAVPQGELQAPLPESITAQADPAATADKLMPEQVVQQIVQLPVQKPVVRHVCEERVVYVPVYRTPRIYRPAHVYVPRFHYRRHHVHFGPRFHRGFRRW
jgi:hypothetical protein